MSMTDFTPSEQIKKGVLAGIGNSDFTDDAVQPLMLSSLTFDTLAFSEDRQTYILEVSIPFGSTLTKISILANRIVDDYAIAAAMQLLELPTGILRNSRHTLDIIQPDSESYEAMGQVFGGIIATFFYDVEI